MGVIATAELTIDTSLERAFQQFIDFSSWDLWMPETLRPISGPSRGLREGDLVRVAIGNPRARLNCEIRVVRVRPNRELCWRGGLPGVLISEHSFFFRELASQTALRSEEPLTGILAHGLLGRSLERGASEFGASVLSRFAAFLRNQHTVP